MTARSSTHDVRNPVAGIPGVLEVMRKATPEARQLLIDILRPIEADARQRAEKSWRTHKGPMASYWKAKAVDARHIRRALQSISTVQKIVQVMPGEPVPRTPTGWAEIHAENLRKRQAVRP